LSTGRSRTGVLQIVGSSLDCTKDKIKSKVIYVSKKVAGIHVNTPKTCADEHGEAKVDERTEEFFNVGGGIHNSRELKLVMTDAPISVIIPKSPVHANSNQTIPRKVLFPIISKKIMGKIRSSPIADTAIR